MEYSPESYGILKRPIFSEGKGRGAFASFMPIYRQKEGLYIHIFCIFLN